MNIVVYTLIKGILSVIKDRSGFFSFLNIDVYFHSMCSNITTLSAQCVGLYMAHIQLIAKVYLWHLEQSDVIIEEKTRSHLIKLCDQKGSLKHNKNCTIPLIILKPKKQSCLYMIDSVMLMYRQCFIQKYTTQVTCKSLQLEY